MKVRLKGTGSYKIQDLTLVAGEEYEIDDPAILAILAKESSVELMITEDDFKRLLASDAKAASLSLGNAQDRLIYNHELMMDTTYSVLLGEGNVVISGDKGRDDIERVNTFFRLAITNQTMLPDVRTVMSNVNAWQESKINFAASPTMPGVAGVRSDSDLVEITTVSLRSEIPVTEKPEDVDQRPGWGFTHLCEAAEAAGRDIEDLLINGRREYNLLSPDSALHRLGKLDGWIKQAQGPAGNVYNVDGIGKDYQSVFKGFLGLLPDKYRRDKDNMRFYVPSKLEENYRDQLAQSIGGDAWLEGRQLKYQEIPIFPVPLLAVSEQGLSSVLLTNRLNLYAAYRRQVRLETWHDPKQGTDAMISSVRVGAQIAHVSATAIAINVEV